MRFLPGQIERRRPVWAAMSELFLDTELQEPGLRRIARVLAGSGYDDGELHEILYGEVFPVCIWNMRCVAGEWTGFDIDWLQERIVGNGWKLWKRWGLLQPDRRMIRDDWQAVLTFVREAREQRDPTPP
jgi:hypothetical protein